MTDKHDTTDSLSTPHSLDAIPTIDEDLNRDEATRANRISWPDLRGFLDKALIVGYKRAS
jgi:hypothetical protein